MFDQAVVEFQKAMELSNGHPSHLALLGARLCLVMEEGRGAASTHQVKGTVERTLYLAGLLDVSASALAGRGNSVYKMLVSSKIKSKEQETKRFW